MRVDERWKRFCTKIKDKEHYQTCKAARKTTEGIPSIEENGGG